MNIITVKQKESEVWTVGSWFMKGRDITGIAEWIDQHGNSSVEPTLEPEDLENAHEY